MTLLRLSRSSVTLLQTSETDVSALLTAAGFHDVRNHLITQDNNTLGWLTTGQSRPGR